MLDPRNGPAWDRPRPARPARTFVLASTPRTGSTLLCRLLWDTGRVGAPKEYLNPMQVRDWEVRFGTRTSRWRHRLLRGPLLALSGCAGWPDARLRAHLHRVRARRTGPSGWFGLKVHQHHFRDVFVGPGRAVEAILGPVTWLRTTREDRLAQAISWARALQTGRWAHHQRAWLPPIYSRRRIDACLDRIDAHEAAWDTYFATHGIEPLHLTYEALAADSEATIRRVLDHLGEQPTGPIAPDLVRQADHLTERWTHRYRRGDRGQTALATGSRA